MRFDKFDGKSVSIIIPILNQTNKISLCLDSILNQIYQNFELLLIDDWSTDGSSEICMNFAKNHSKFQYFYKSNGRVSSARNFGIEKVKMNLLHLLIQMII